MSKAIDAAMGAEREVIRVPAADVRNPKSIRSGHGVEGGEPAIKGAAEPAGFPSYLAKTMPQMTGQNEKALDNARR